MKNYSKGAKLRAKKAMTPLAQLAETPKRKSRGSKRMQEIAKNPDAERTVLEARARHCGIVPADRTQMRDPALGEPAGRAIYAAHSGDHARRMWDTYASLTKAEAIYIKTNLGLSTHAKTAKVEYLIETFEARSDDNPDMRNEDERARDASNRWMRWRGYIGHLGAHEQGAIFDVAYGRIEPMDAGSLTSQGRRFVAAIERLADVVNTH
jgi:hypothetical protein